MGKPAPVDLTLAQYAREVDRLRRTSARSFDGLRRLENAVRRHANRECDCVTDRECMNRLVTLVPKVPRPTRAQARKLAVAKVAASRKGGSA